MNYRWITAYYPTRWRTKCSRSAIFSNRDCIMFIYNRTVAECPILFGQAEGLVGKGPPVSALLMKRREFVVGKQEDRPCWILLSIASCKGSPSGAMSSLYSQ